MPAQTVSYGNPYSEEEADILRRQRMAELLQAQSQQPMGGTEMAGGVAIRRSPLEGLAQMGKAASARAQMEDAQARRRALAERVQGDAMKWYGERPQGTPAQIQDTAQEGTGSFDMSGSAGPANVAAQAPNEQQQMAWLMKGGANPMTAPMAQAMMARQLQGPQRVDLGDKIGLLDANGNLIGSIPKGATPDAALKESGANQRHLTPSGSAQLGSATTLQTHASPSGSALVGAATARRGQDMTDARAAAQLDQGKTPPGYRATPEGNLKAIPGGPADTKLQGAFNQDTAMLTNSSAGMDRLATAANEAMNHPGLAGTAGLRGAIPNIPGTQAADAAALLNTLKSQVAFGVLQDMRNNSKTGGALGNVSDAEGKRLEANLAALEKSQSVDQLKASLKKIIDYTQGAKERLRDSFNLKHSGDPGAPKYSGPERRAAQDDPLGLRK